MKLVACILLLGVCSLLFGVAEGLGATGNGARRSRRSGWPSPKVPLSRLQTPGSLPGTQNCTERYITQKMDHFSFGPMPRGIPETYQQRYFTCLEGNWTPGSPIFFYTGNEVDVALFVNMTGLMWENAPTFGAMLIFAEHRYFGKSLPFPNETLPEPAKLQWLTTDLAMADFANLIFDFKQKHSSMSSKVIAFGGSYGGMLCAWFRMKYPGSVDGCIAGSAPIANFMYMDPPYNPESFQAQVSFDATTAGGSNDWCFKNIRSFFNDVFAVPHKTIESHMGLCPGTIRSVNDIYTLYDYINSAFAFMAMSSYPYPSGYLLLGGGGVLPAYPERVACSFLSREFHSFEEQLYAMRSTLAVYYNATGNQPCFNPNTPANEATVVTDYLWGYLECTTMLQPFGQNGINDMFWPSPWNLTEAIEGCEQQYGVVSQPDWVAVNFGGKGVAEWGSNIVFSNGQLDPWRPGGILNATAPTIETILIADVGHHIDLMFSDPADTPAIKDARKREIAFIAKVVGK